MNKRGAEGVLLTGVHGSGQSSVAEEIAHLLEQRGERDDLREAAASIALAEGTGVEDVTIKNDAPIGVVARQVMKFLGWS